MDKSFKRLCLFWESCIVHVPLAAFSSKKIMQNEGCKKNTNNTSTVEYYLKGKKIGKNPSQCVNAIHPAGNFSCWGTYGRKNIRKKRVCVITFPCITDIPTDDSQSSCSIKPISYQVLLLFILPKAYNKNLRCCSLYDF